LGVAETCVLCKLFSTVASARSFRPVMPRSLRQAQGQPLAVSLAHFTDAEVSALVHATLDVVLVLDRQGRYLKIGSNSRHHLYRPASELLGKRLQDVLP